MDFKGSDDKGNNLIIQLSGLDYSVETHGFHCHFKKIGLYCILATIGIHRLFVANMTFFSQRLTLGSSNQSKKSPWLSEFSQIHHLEEPQWQLMNPSVEGSVFWTQVLNTFGPNTFEIEGEILDVKGVQGFPPGDDRVRAW